MIFCLGLAADETFVHTLLAMKRAGLRFEALDFAQFAYSGTISIPVNDVCAARLTLNGKHHVLATYNSAWVRLIDISVGAPNEMLQRRASGLLQALSRLFSSAPVPTINPPLKDVSNYTKLFHAVDLAAVGGWSIPRSCLTSSALQARDFIASCGAGAIFKGISATKTWATLYEEQTHGHRLPLIESCPVLFQERIDGPDVRVHVIEDRTFGELIESPDLDYRTSRQNRFERIAVPRDIANGCAHLTRECGIPFLGVDFKLQRSSGDWYFLEANSLPCYQGYDLRAGRAISREIVSWLSTRMNSGATRPRQSQHAPDGSA